jgi:5-methyltetrahydropteroyltriglutamate--homocysteine methyltransferase
MPVHPNGPYRADHVGSLLRPKSVLDARKRRAAGEISAEELRDFENEAIIEAIKLQEDVGLKGVTDGEFRRMHFHTDFLVQIGGMEMRGGIAAKFQKEGGDLEFAPPKLVTTGKLEHIKPIMRADYEFIAAHTRETPKITLPSPSMAHFRGGRDAISKEAYPDIEQFFEDLVEVYRQEVNDLAAAGCRYLQFDDTNLAYLCDPKLRDAARARGENPDALPKLYADLLNRAIADRPKDMRVTIHLCRGNFRSAWVAEGGYDPVAEAMFGGLDIDGYFLEFDDERSGNFAPLRYVRPDTTIVLGVISSKRQEMESKDAVKRRIDEAATVLDADQLALSAQCGFSSTEHGNDIDFDTQRRKLELVVEIAEEYWGGVGPMRKAA